MRAELARRARSASVPVPHELQPAERVAETMQPVLRLLNGTLPYDPNYGRGVGRALASGLYETVPLARLSFRYGPVVLPRTRRQLPRLTAQDGHIYEVARDFGAEIGAITTLEELGLVPVQDLVPVYFAHAHTDDFALREYRPNPILAADRHAGGAQAAKEAPAGSSRSTPMFPVQVLSRRQPTIDAELVEGSGIDWLELHLGVMVGRRARRSGPCRWCA